MKNKSAWTWTYHLYITHTNIRTDVNKLESIYFDTKLRKVSLRNFKGVILHAHHELMYNISHYYALLHISVYFIMMHLYNGHVRLCPHFHVTFAVDLSVFGHMTAALVLFTDMLWPSGGPVTVVL